MDLITRAAGTGEAGNSGDGGPATGARLTAPAGLAVTRDGGFLVTDFAGHVVRRVSAAGVITRVAGSGTAGNSGDGGPATQARLSWPEGLAVTADGGFLVADFGNHQVRKVSADGAISRVAGTGQPGNGGDGGPATEAQLHNPAGIAVTADGGFLIADFGNHVVRGVSAAGVISRVAGTGQPGSAGDGEPASQARLTAPAGIAVTADGGFLVTDNGGHVVYRVSGAGVITRVAGTGQAGNSGNHGPARQAQLAAPSGIDVTADGGFLVADFAGHVVRRVSPDGVISRVAGTSLPGRGAADGPAADAQLHQPNGIAVTADGGFLVADFAGHAVLKVAGPDPEARILNR